MIEGLAPGPGLEPQVVVDDLGAARARLTEHGVEVSDVLEVAQEGGTSVYRPVKGEPIGWNAYAFFNDPDGNGWVLQQRPPEGEGGDR